MRIRPSLRCSVMIGLAAGLNLYSFEYLKFQDEIHTRMYWVRMTAETHLFAYMMFCCWVV